nr:MAG TPA: Head fiber protein [Caudoviricetes sp.]
MFLGQNREHQYKPGVEKILLDVIGGGTIDRGDLRSAVFPEGKADELPPLTPVVKDPATGVYHVVKTARVYEAASAAKYKVEKKHFFAVGDAVTLGGAFDKASDVIKDVDKSDPTFDTLTLAGTVGAAAKGDVLVLAKDKQAAGSAIPKYGDKESEIYLTMDSVRLDVANQASGLLAMGAVNEASMIFPMDRALKARTHISFV